jgi:hypothetical protein
MNAHRSLCCFVIASLSLVACGGDDPAPANGGSGATAGSGAVAGTGGSGTAGTGGTGGSSAGTGGDSGTSGAAGTGGTGGATDAYPAGPYGADLDATIQNYGFTGFVNDDGSVLSTTLAQRAYSFDELRKSGARYALLHLSEDFCPGCKDGAEDLAAGSAAVQAKGAVVLEILMTGDVAPWSEAYDLKVSVLKPAAGSTLKADLGGREWAYIVALPSMKIVWKKFGSFGPTTNSSAKQALAELDSLLGP